MKVNVNLFLLLIVAFNLILGESAKALCTQRSKNNLYKGPSVQYELSWQVGKYMPFKKLGEKQSWIKVQDIDGEIHWISKSNVTESFPCGVIKLNHVNIRTQPKKNGSLAQIPFADKYTPFKKIDRDEQWIEIEDQWERRGWVFEDAIWFPVTFIDVEF